MTRHVRMRVAPRLATVSMVLAVGCYGGLDLDANNGDGIGGGGDTDGSGADTNGSDPPSSELPAPTTRLFRLTHVQWENTVADLLYLPQRTGLSVGFRADPGESGYLFDNNALGLEVDGALWVGYQRAAADIAQMVASDPSLVEQIAPAGASDPERADQFVRQFGRRAFRRPLIEDEVSAFSDLFDSGPALYSELDGFEAGLRIVVETMLQSPHFVYRIETSTEAEGSVIPLNDFEIANRMSYFLWDSMPDDALFDAAEAGDLTTTAGVESHARRMLQDPRARSVIERFHETVFEADRFDGIAPSSAFFPDAPDDLGASARQELQMFVDHVVFDDEGSVHDLLTSNRTFVNDDLAAIYGIDGDFGSEFEPVDLDPTQRRGILTQVGFLALNASTVNPDPIHRGVFIAKHITCTKIPAPPDGVPPLPPPQGKSNRQTVAEHTEQPGTDCRSCHSTIINPNGFPFENYDATGAFRTEDNGHTVDASATVTLDGEQYPVDDALDFIDLLASSPKVHACYLEHWVQYANGRPSADEDDPLVERLTVASADEDVTVQDLLVRIMTAQPFVTRASEELP